MIRDGVIELRIGSAVLLAVPAVHYQAAFAQRVNQVCGEPAEQPDAIAVELGPLIAAAASQWLSELGVGPAQRTRVPCMLGLAKQNRLLRPSVRERAIELQRETGYELGDLAPRLLHEELGFSRLHVLMLSPTDSIVEALRCALELGIPVYGVDLDDTADGHYQRQMLPDPAGANQDPGGYLRAMVPMAAAAGADPEVDPRREYVMAARLKTLLARHQRLLFTGGLAHWARISHHLADPQLPQVLLPHERPEQSQPGSIRRSIVHPSLAAHFMDAFPAIASVFERRRRHPRLDGIRPVRPIDPLPILHARLRRACRQQLAAAVASTSGKSIPAEQCSLNAFEQMLIGQTLLNMRRAPTLSVIDACARATLSPSLRGCLYAALTDFLWLDAADYPDCLRLRPPSGAEGAPGQIVLCEDGWGPGQPQQASFQPPPETPPRTSYDTEPWQQQLAEDVLGLGYRFCWRPWESLATALCCSAIAQTQGRQREACAERFAGQLLDGIAIKSTLRAYARGQDEIWVRGERPQKGRPSSTSPEGFPVVWILEGGATDSSRWSMFFEPIAWLEEYARDRQEFHRRFAGSDTRLINHIAYGNDPERLQDRAAGRFECLGLIVFSPVFAASRQSCRWLEATSGRHNPLVPMTRTVDTVVADLARSQGFTAEAMRWQDLLVAMSLPHAGSGMTLVAPPAFEPDATLLATASRRGKTIRRLPLSAFENSQIHRLGRLDSMPGWMDKRDGQAFYCAEAESLAGESTDRYLDLVPPYWRRYGLDR